MQSQHISYKDTGFFSKLILDFLDEKDSVKQFVGDFFDKDKIPEYIAERKKFNIINRAEISKTLADQYAGIPVSKKTKENLELLKKDNTFTFVTAHQLNLFSGPLYYFIKICHCLNACEQLNKDFPANNFVPIFWINTEDHDFDEVNHFNLYGKKIEWESDEKGAVGLFKMDGIDKVIEELKTVLGEHPNAAKIIELYSKFYLKDIPYREAVFQFVNEIFGEHGLIILDQQTAELKKQIKPFIVDELTKHNLYRTLLENEKELSEAGFHQQALPRAINLFYIDESKARNRIIYKDDQYLINNTELVFTEDEILEELEKNPIRFSTNVLSRPIYQQRILPNLAYIGGGGETAYWMQLKKSFEHFEVFFPKLILRNSILVIDKGSAKKMNGLNLSADQVFGETELMVKAFVKDNTESNLSLEEEKKVLQETFEQIKRKVLEIDASLEKSVMGEMSKQLNSINNLESKILKAEKKKFEIKTNQIRGVKSKLFPNGKLQERHDNIISFWMKYGFEFVDVLKSKMDPFGNKFTILIEE